MLEPQLSDTMKNLKAILFGSESVSGHLIRKDFWLKDLICNQEGHMLLEFKYI